MGNRVALIVKVGNKQTSKGKEHLGLKHGDLICYIDEKDWGMKLEEILSKDMFRIFACVQINRAMLPNIARWVLPAMTGDEMVRPKRRRINFAALNDNSLESRLQSSECVPLINGTELTSDAFIDTTVAASPSIIDFNAISAGSASVGIGGTYATWAATFADLSNLTGNLTFTQISPTSENASALITENLNSYTLECTSNTKHLGNTNWGHLTSVNFQGFLFDLQQEGPGNLNIHDLSLKETGAVHADKRFMIVQTITTGSTIRIYNMMFDFNAIARVGVVINSLNPVVYVYNSMFWDIGNHALQEVAIQSATVSTTSILGNNTIYSGPASGWGIDLNNRNITVSNNVCVNPLLTAYSRIGSGTGRSNIGSDTTGADSNWGGTGTGNQVSLTAADIFQSTDDTIGTRFLYPKGTQIKNPYTSPIPGHTTLINGAPINAIGAKGFLASDSKSIIGINTGIGIF